MELSTHPEVTPLGEPEAGDSSYAWGRHLRAALIPGWSEERQHLGASVQRILRDSSARSQRI
jgi:hypothetical protein